MGTVAAVRFRIEKHKKYNRLDKAAVADYFAANSGRGVTYAQAAADMGARLSTVYSCCRLLGLQPERGLARLRSQFDAKYGAGALDKFIEARKRRATLRQIAAQFGFTFQQAHYYWRRIRRMKDVEICKP